MKAVNNLVKWLQYYNSKSIVVCKQAKSKQSQQQQQQQCELKQPESTESIKSTETRVIRDTWICSLKFKQATKEQEQKKKTKKNQNSHYNHDINSFLELTLDV